MGSRNKYQSRENRAKGREVLMREWDPLDVRDVTEAQDEYNSYAANVYVMLTDERASADTIAAYLLNVINAEMGLPNDSTQYEAAQRTAEALVALRPTFEIH
jgi:hypothetical protein